jgi:hypothetical protein
MHLVAVEVSAIRGDAARRLQSLLAGQHGGHVEQAEARHRARRAFHAFRVGDARPSIW